MTADKRSVHTDALETLGTIIGPDERRDAIHLAVEPVVAAEDLYPGMHVRLCAGGKARTAPTGNGVGIVDPFLTEPISAGERFWLVVYPRKITSLRHVWEHPDFAAGEEAQHIAVYSTREQVESEAWIRSYVDELNAGYSDYEQGYGVTRLTYEELMEAADDNRKDNSGWGSYLVKGPLFDGVYTKEEFWYHYGVVRGVEIPEENRNNFFSCSC